VPRRPRSRTRSAALIAAALAVIVGAIAVRDRLPLPRPGSRGSETSPGARATRTARTLAQLEGVSTDGSPVVLNEIATVNAHVLLDEEGAAPDWMELYNRSDARVDLGGFSLADGRDPARRWILPEYSLAPGQHLIVFASGRDRVGSAIARTLDVDLDPNARAERVVTEPPVRIVDPNRVRTPVRRVSVSLPLSDRGPWELWVGARASGDAPASLRVSVDGRDPVESVLRPSRRLRHLRVGTGVRGEGVRTVVLESDASVYVSRISFARPQPNSGRYGLHLHASFRLSRSGETLVLLDPRGAIADYVTPERFVPGDTWQRVPDGAAHFEIAAPTPLGRPMAEAPDLSGPVAVPPGPLRIAPSLPDGVDALHYTLDGSPPRIDSPRLETPLVIASPTYLRVRGFRGRLPVTAVVSRLFHPGAVPDALVVSVGIDSRALYDPEWGIVPNNAARGTAWERTARVLVFDDRGVYFDGEAGLRTHAGNGSDRGRATSFQLRWRPSLGAAGSTRDPFLPALTPPPDRMILDAAAGAWADRLAYDLAAASGGIAARSRRAVLLLNGRVHNRVIAFEDVDDGLLQSRFGHTDFDLIKGKPLKLKRGDWKRLRATAARLSSGRLVLDAAQADVDLASALAAHFALIFGDATDGGQLPDDAVQGYLAIARTRTEGLVHEIPWDLDHGFRKLNPNALAAHQAFVREQPWDTRYLTEQVIERLLADDPDFRPFYRDAAQRFLAVARETRWLDEIDALESLDVRWGRPRGVEPERAASPEELQAWREQRGRVYDRARVFFGDGIDLLWRQVEAATGGGD
jgi:hypothetical protein